MPLINAQVYKMHTERGQTTYTDEKTTLRLSFELNVISFGVQTSEVSIDKFRQKSGPISSVDCVLLLISLQYLLKDACTERKKERVIMY